METEGGIETLVVLAGIRNQQKEISGVTRKKSPLQEQ